MDIALWIALVVALVQALAAIQPVESTSCQTDIVSSSVVATFCGHRQGDNLVLDLLILWRGQPGWYFGTSQRGTAGSSTFGGGLKGTVSSQEMYGNVTIGFEADFDRRSATIGAVAVDLRKANTFVIDGVEADRKVFASIWIEPRMPLTGDWNLALARQSREVREALRCDIPMVAAPAPNRIPVMTVCERLKRQ